MNSDQRPIVLRNALLWDGTGGDPRPGSDLLIEGGRIASVGAVPERGGAEMIDLDGRTVIPGLMDCHVHIAFNGDPDEVARLPGMSTASLAWQASENARRTLEAGFTAVRDLGTRDNIAIHLRDEIAAGRLPGPRIRAVGALVCITGGHGWFIGRQADGPDEIRKAVREQLRAGADCIKFTATGGVMTPGVDPRAASFTEEELRAGVEEAHKAFRRAAAHAQGTSGIKNAVRAGIDSIEHGIFMDDEVLEEMRLRGTFFVPTLVAPENIARHGIEAGIPRYAVEKSEQVRDVHRESFRKALKAGVRIAMGTDAGTPFNRHGENAQEIVSMVDAGMAPADALLAATRNAAELLDILDDAGTLEAGKRADLVIVDGDPLTDVTILQRPEAIAGVLSQGRWAKRDAKLGADVARV